MTSKQELGFEITNSFFQEYNENLKEEEKKFSSEFLKVEEEIRKHGKNLVEFERVLDKYIETIKREYYKAGMKMTDLVYFSDLKEIKEEFGA